MIQDIAPHKLANEFRGDAAPVVGDLVLFVRGQELAVRRLPEKSFEFPRVGDEGVPAEGLTYLFALDEHACWLAPDAGLADPPSGYELVSNRDLRMESRGPREMMYVAYTAVHLGGWYARTRYCGSCGKPM